MSKKALTASGSMNGKLDQSHPSPLRGEGKGEGPRSLARHLRRNQTDAEQKLWALLRARQIDGLKFRRQHPIGPYIADFCCLRHHLVVELDGGHHAETAQKDTVRSQWLNSHGYHVLRFWNHEVLTQPEAVIDAILSAVSTPHPNPLPEGRGDKKKPSHLQLYADGGASPLSRERE